MMRGSADAILAVASWSLATIFAYAGAAKLKHPKLAALALTDFRLVRRPRVAFGRTAGAVEMAVAALLVVAPLARYGWAAAAALLWFFVWLLARTLRSGAAFACFCFGDPSSPISALSVARTALLAAFATAGAAAVALDPYAVTGSLTEAATAAVAGAGLTASTALAATLPALLRLNDDFMHPGGGQS